MSLTEYPDLIQRSEEWYQLRRGIVTASTIGALITAGSPGADAYECHECAAPAGEPCISLRGGTPIKTMHSARHESAAYHAATAPPVLKVADNDTSRGLIRTLAAERIAGLSEDGPMTSDMWRGVNSEPYARAAYEQHTGVEVREVGFMVRDDSGVRIGYSPDGLVGTEGSIEIKAPRAKTHVATILADEVPAQYMPQLQTGLYVSGRDWIDYISFSGGLHLYPKRVHPDAAWQTVIRAAALAAEERITDLTTRYAAAVEGLPLTEPIPQLDEITV